MHAKSLRYPQLGTLKRKVLDARIKSPHRVKDEELPFHFPSNPSTSLLIRPLSSNPSPSLLILPLPQTSSNMYMNYMSTYRCEPPSPTHSEGTMSHTGLDLILKRDPIVRKVKRVSTYMCLRARVRAHNFRCIRTLLGPLIEQHINAISQ